jgi:hypothetical protein
MESLASDCIIFLKELILALKNYLSKKEEKKNIYIYILTQHDIYVVTGKLESDLSGKESVICELFS